MCFTITQTDRTRTTGLFGLFGPIWHTCRCLVVEPCFTENILGIMFVSLKCGKQTLDLDQNVKICESSMVYNLLCLPWCAFPPVGRSS